MSLIRGDVLEIDKSTNEVVWSLVGVGARDAYRLKNGNTLVLTKTRVFEVDRRGKEIWSKGGMTYGSVRR